MSRTRLLVALAIVAVLVVALAAPVLAATSPVRITESNEKYHFTPASTTVRVGDTVTWQNTSDAAHTVTSDSGTELGSDNIADGKSFSHTFASTGTFSYHCTIHSYMTGKVVVVAAGAAAPQTDTATPTDTTPSSRPLGALFVVGVAAAILAVRRLRDRPDRAGDGGR